MPADRITSVSPWHVVLVIDDSESMTGQPASEVNKALRAMVAEMEVIAKGTKPYFKISIVSFGDSAEILAEAKGERDIDINTIANFSGSSGSTKYSEAFARAAEVLKRNPGKDTDFRPYVFFFSDGHPNPDDVDDALEKMKELKHLNIAAGNPTIVTLGFGDLDRAIMKQVANNPELFKEIKGPEELVRLLPAIGTIAGAKTGESAINTAIINL